MLWDTKVSFDHVVPDILFMDRRNNNILAAGPELERCKPPRPL